MSTNGETILEHITNSKVKQVVFTGHSLGGGLAQVAHLFALANWKELHPTVTFRTLTFSAPMTFFRSATEIDEMEKNTKGTKNKLEMLDKELAEQTRNFVFCGDVVPRLAGNTDYVMSVLDELQKESQENAMHNILSTLAKPFFDVRKRIAAGVQSLASEDGDLTFLGQYKHLSQLIYYQEMLTKDDSEYKYECDLLSAEAFAGIKITDENSETGGWVGTSWSGPSRWFHNPKSRSTKDRFKTVADYLKDVHTVLPYAMSPIYNEKKSDQSKLTQPVA